MLRGTRFDWPESSSIEHPAEPIGDRRWRVPGSPATVPSGETDWMAALMTIPLERVRAETPGAGHVAHFDNAGAALMARPVLDAVVGHLELEASIGGYQAGARAGDAIAKSYDAVARLLNCEADEVAIVENATVAWNMAFHGLAHGFEPGDRVLTTMAEYASNYIAYLQVQARTGIAIEAVPNDRDGGLDCAALEAMIDPRVKLIAVNHVPTNGGLVNPAASIGEIANRHAIPYLLDACQSIGQMPIDVRAIGCDMASATARKYLRGPRGVGFLYVKRSMLERLEPTFLDLHAAQWVDPDRYEMRPDARRFENWENYVAGKIGLGVAVDYALGLGLESTYLRIQTLASALRDRLTALPGIAVTDLGRERCGIVTFAHAKIAPGEFAAALRDRAINVATSSRFSTLLDMDARGLDMVVRASVHYYNTEAEIDRLVAAVGHVIQAGPGR